MRKIAILAVALGLLYGCGEEKGVPKVQGFSCANYSFSATGGDIVGTWNWQAYCPDQQEQSLADAVGPECANSSLATTLAYADTWTFNADGTHAGQESVSGTLTSSIDQACGEKWSGQPGTTIADFCNTMQTMLLTPRSQGGFGYDSGSCSVNASSVCQCNGTRQSSTPYNGTYSVAGTMLTINNTQLPYSVANGQLSLDFTDPAQPNDPVYSIYGK